MLLPIPSGDNESGDNDVADHEAGDQVCLMLRYIPSLLSDRILEARGHAPPSFLDI